MKTCVLAFTLLLGLTAAAESRFTGQFIRSNDGIFLNLSRHRTYKIAATIPLVVSTLSKLSNADLVMGDGSIDEMNNEITISTIDSVGLKELLGAWSASTGCIFNFIDYKTLRSYSEDSVHFFSTVTEYTYVISPSDSSQWKIFISTDKSVNLGTLTLNTDSAQIELYDTNSGEIKSTINLTKSNQ